MTAPRAIRILFQKEWAASERRGLLAPDPRVRTLGRVLVSYPEVRHIVPDRISRARWRRSCASSSARPGW
jgi:hypothetical protein